MLAAQAGHTACVRFLHQRGVPLEDQDRYSNTVLDLARAQSRHRVVVYLQAQGPLMQPAAVSGAEETMAMDINPLDYNSIKAALDSGLSASARVVSGSTNGMKLPMFLLHHQRMFLLLQLLNVEIVSFVACGVDAADMWPLMTVTSNADPA